MTYATIHTCTEDTELQERVIAAASKEAWANVDLGATPYGERLRTYPQEALVTFMWVIAIDNEAAYEYALGASNPNPGSDPGVISDANLQAGVQAHWPASTTVPLPTDMVGPTPGEPASAP